jgi:hypothetical protein
MKITQQITAMKNVRLVMQTTKSRFFGDTTEINAYIYENGEMTYKDMSLFYNIENEIYVENKVAKNFSISSNGSSCVFTFQALEKYDAIACYFESNGYSVKRETRVD